MVPELHKSMILNAPHMCAASQHDAHEFFVAFVEALGRHFDFTMTEEQAPLKHFFVGTLRSTLVCLACT
jgi:hypothetical protein